MAAGDGIPRVTAALVKLANAASDAAIQLERDAAAAANTQAIIAKTTAMFSDLTTAAGESAAAGDEFVSTLNTLLNVQTALNDGYAQANTQGNAGSQSGYQAQVLSGLQKLEAGATALGPGQGSAIATMIDKIAQELAGGIINPSQAIQAIQALIGPYSSGLMQEVADPTLSPALKAFDEELLRLLAGGQLPS